MITPERALRTIRLHCGPLGNERVALDDALGRTLAEDILTPFPFPRFDNTAMDGFCVCSRDTEQATAVTPARLTIAGTIFAGAATATLAKRQAYRIMTGAPLPRGADGVIPVETANVDGDTLVVTIPVVRRRHVRRRGEELGAGKRILDAGTAINPGVLACLASVGRANVRVVRQPRVAVVSTGDETVAPGTRLRDGEIYDSNATMLVAMLREMGIEPERVRRVGDRRAALKSALRAALTRCDVVITAGGVSVGDHDFLRPVLEELRVQEVFWRVRQKPGKPFYFGARGAKRVFGLPGNPASAFVCFYYYVYAALRWMSGLREGALVRESLATGDDIAPDGKRWLLLRGSTRGARPGQVKHLPGQGSHMVAALAGANRLIVVPAGRRRIQKGQNVMTLRLPDIGGRG